MKTTTFSFSGTLLPTNNFARSVAPLQFSSRNIILIGAAPMPAIGPERRAVCSLGMLRTRISWCLFIIKSWLVLSPNIPYAVPAALLLEITERIINAWVPKKRR
jgi:hypothetical protein